MVVTAARVSRVMASDGDDKGGVRFNPVSVSPDENITETYSNNTVTWRHYFRHWPYPGPGIYRHADVVHANHIT